MAIKLKRVILVLLSFVLLLQTVLLQPVYADMDSNDFRKEFIAIKKGQAMGDIDTNKITMEELRFLAIFLSNFYIPWSTSFDYADENSEEQEKAKEKMIETMSDVCGLDKTMAKALVNAVFKASLQSAKPLYYDYKTDDKHKSTHESALSLTRMLGQTKKSHNYIWDADTIKNISVAQDGKTTLPTNTFRLTYGSLLALAHNSVGGDVPTVQYYWADDKGENKGKVVFANNDSSNAALAHCLSSINASGGIGSAVLSVTPEEAKNLGENINKALMPYAQVYTDWVGNIFVDDGYRRVIIVPACSNPYTFSKINKDWERGHFNLVSLSGIYGLAHGEIVDSIEEKEPEGKYCMVMKSDGIVSAELWKTSYGSGTDLDVTNLGEGLESLATKLKEDFKPTETNSMAFPNLDSLVINSGDSPMTLRRDTKVYTEYVWVDKLGEAEWDNDSAFQVANVIDNPLQVKTGMTFSNIKQKAQTMSIDNADGATLEAIYLTYLYAYSNFQTGDKEFDADKHKVNMRYAGERFPQDFDNQIDWSGVEEELSEEAEEEKAGEVLSMIYYILHPAKGMHYVSVWAKNKISAVLLGWHTDMVGASESNTSTGMTRYIGFTGYTTLPALDDLTWTSWVVENYNSIIVYLIIIISVILCCYIIVGSLTAQRAILGMVMFGVLAFLPPVAINASVGVVNQTCDALYGTKFTYWALIQHQSYMQELHTAMTEWENDNKEAYTNLVMGNQVKYATSEDGNEPALDAAEQTDAKFASVKLKWMSPKKFNYLAQYAKDMSEAAEINPEDVEEDKEKKEEEKKKKDEDDEEGDEDAEDADDAENKVSEGSTLVTSNNIVNFGRGMLTKAVSGEEFLKEPDALYLYRDYLDVTTFALKSYNLYTFYHGGASGAGNYVNNADGDYKVKVGSYWTGDEENKKIEYTSGVRLQDTIFANYEISKSTYPVSKSEFRELSSTVAMRKGFLYNTLQVDGSGGDVTQSMDYYGDNNMAVNYLLNFKKPYLDIYKAKERLEEDLKNNTTEISRKELKGYGIPQQYFNFVQQDLTTSKGEEKYSDKDKLDYFYYGMYSESPYYFFNYNVQDQLYAKTDYSYSNSSDSTEKMKDLFLGNNLEYFFNYSEDSGDGFGELRDFMNMHDFFYYVVPLMKEGVDLVETFDKAYGMPLYDDIKIQFTMDGGLIVVKDGTKYVLDSVTAPDGTKVKYEGNPDGLGSITYEELIKDWTEEELYKFWHNYNVVTLFNAYCTWVDAMYDCKYAEPETIRIAGKKKHVEDPLDPTCYYTSPEYQKDAHGKIMEDEDGNPIITGYKFDGRPMVFSRSEQKYYGLQWNDLTKVEQKIITVQEKVYEKSIDLMNYYTFDDNVISSAFSMIQLFEFNKEFSQNSFISSSYVMYPQSYELKAFTYDAYLRLIITNTTGDSLQTDDARSLYERTMDNSSITFGILLVILDILCVYLIPVFKVFFLIVLFLMSIVMIVGSAVKIELNLLTVTWKSLIRPLASFCAITIGLAFLVSLFMYNGAKGVTGDTQVTIQLGDPTMVTVVMIFLNACALYLYYKVCKQVASDFIKYAKAVANNIGGTALGALKTIGGVALAGTAINALRDKEGSGGPRAPRGGNGGKLEPAETGKGGKGGSGGSGSDGFGGSGDGSDGSGGNGHGQDPLAMKPDNEKAEGNSTKSYEDKVKAGKERREAEEAKSSDSDSNTSMAGAGVVAGAGAVAGDKLAKGTDDAKVNGAKKTDSGASERTKKKLSKENIRTASREEVPTVKKNTGDKLESARTKATGKKKQALAQAKESGSYSKVAKAPGSKKSANTKKTDMPLGKKPVENKKTKSRKTSAQKSNKYNAKASTSQKKSRNKVSFSSGGSKNKARTAKRSAKKRR